MNDIVIEFISTGSNLTHLSTLTSFLRACETAYEIYRVLGRERVYYSDLNTVKTGGCIMEIYILLQDDTRLHCAVIVVESTLHITVNEIEHLGLTKESIRTNDRETRIGGNGGEN